MEKWINQFFLRNTQTRFMNNIEQEIRNNLYEFYDYISQIGGIYSEEEDHWSVIRNVSGSWPRIIYNIDPEIATPESSIIFEEKIKSGTYPEILITSDQNIREIDPFLRSKGFYPFSAWKGMAAKGIDISVPDLPEDLELLKPDSPEDIEQWIKIVTSQLISPARLDKTLVDSFITQPGMEIFLLKHKGVGVSTIFVFTSETSTGLYLLATEKSAQRQGFGKFLIHWVSFLEARKSNKPIILHATSKGEAIYLKLGFKPYNQFFLYRYLNTQL